MPQTETAKSDASADERLAYIEQLSQTMMGLQSANQALIARRAVAGADETRRIDIEVSVNNSDWAKVSAAMTLYFSEDIQFSPPTPEELAEIEAVVKSLDGIIATQTQVDAIVADTTKLVQAFRDSQP